MNQSANLEPQADEKGAAAMYSLITAAHALEDKIEQALSHHELSMAKLTVLTKLVEAGQPLTLSEIAARLQCVRSNVTQLIDRLEADGLVRRVDDAADRRSIRAELTSAGRVKQESGAEVLNEIQGAFATVLGVGSAADDLLRILARVSA
jgi:DNA-binding MarR family transcriptional regulator